jgi:hypothetical protein
MEIPPPRYPPFPFIPLIPKQARKVISNLKHNRVKQTLVGLLDQTATAAFLPNKFLSFLFDAAGREPTTVLVTDKRYTFFYLLVQIFFSKQMIQPKRFFLFDNKYPTKRCAWQDWLGVPIDSKACTRSVPLRLSTQTNARCEMTKIPIVFYKKNLAIGLSESLVFCGG